MAERKKKLPESRKVQVTTPFGNISVTHYINRKVKPRKFPMENGWTPGSLLEYIAQGPLDNETTYALYYYISIKRQTIHKPSLIEMPVNPENFNSEKIIKATRQEAEDIIYACYQYLLDEAAQTAEANCKVIAHEILSDRKFAAKNPFVNGLNIYVAYFLLDFGNLVDDVIRATIYQNIAKMVSEALYLDSTTAEMINPDTSRINHDGPNKGEWLEFNFRCSDMYGDIFTAIVQQIKNPKIHRLYKLGKLLYCGVPPGITQATVARMTSKDMFNMLYSIIIEDRNEVVRELAEYDTPEFTEEYVIREYMPVADDIITAVGRLKLFRPNVSK